MAFQYERKYDAVDAVYFTLRDPAAPENLVVAHTFVVADIKLSKDGGTFANVTTLPTEVQIGTGIYEWVATTPEDSAKTLILRGSDQTAPAAWIDFAIIIETFGNAAARFPGNLDEENINANIVNVAGVAAEDPLKANLVEVNGTSFAGDNIPADILATGGLASTGFNDSTGRVQTWTVDDTLFTPLANTFEANKTSGKGPGGGADGIFIGRTVIFSSGVNENFRTPIVSYTNANDRFGVAPMPAAPANGDTFTLE